MTHSGLNWQLIKRVRFADHLAAHTNLTIYNKTTHFIYIRSTFHVFKINSLSRESHTNYQATKKNDISHYIEHNDCGIILNYKSIGILNLIYKKSGPKHIKAQQCLIRYKNINPRYNPKKISVNKNTSEGNL